MPQISHGFAVGRVRALQRDSLAGAALDRLALAGSVDELCRALTELGWGEPKVRQDIEALCARRVEAAARVVKHDSPEPNVTDCLLIKYDALNLKGLLKARELGIEAGWLSRCGTLDPERLRRAVDERDYRDLPRPLAEAMDEIERRVAFGMDPLFVDVRLDRAAYQLISENLRGVKDPAIRRYFEARADFANIRIALRLNAMGRGAALAREMMVAGGGLPIDVLAAAADWPERALIACAGRDYLPTIREAARQGGGLARMEGRMDDYLFELIGARRFDVQGVLPLMHHLLAREREAAAVRRIAARQIDVRI